MEVGAVKQAFNNEIIHLKKNLQQARTQIIHKLTRKAKTLAEKKTSEKLKEKLKKKAESAVNEVLILKKIKPRDIAQFSITHKGELKHHLNKPQVDKDKACARLLLHKALQDKYKFIRGRFRDVPIQDLFMSRLERRKLKKEQKEQQKNKKNNKNKNVVNSEGDWDVEDIKISDDLKDVSENDEENNDSDSSKHDLHSESDIMNQDDQNSESGDDIHVSFDENEIGQSDEDDDEIEVQQSDGEQNNCDQSDNEEKSIDMFVKLKPNSEVSLELENNINKPTNNEEDRVKQIKTERKTSVIKHENIKTTLIQKNKPVQKGKNKNLNDKLQTRKFKKDVSDDVSTENKVVDPFFITASGENYLSLAEPRQPDEIKEIHKQGNRKERRAVMFGHVPKIKPRRDDSRQNFNNRFDKRNNNTNRNDNYKDNTNFKNKFNSYGNNKEIFNDKTKSNVNSSFNSSKFNKTDEKKFNNNKSEEKEVKLHPSWEAKKKQSSIVPFKGKKIVFDES